MCCKQLYFMAILMSLIIKNAVCSKCIRLLFNICYVGIVIAWCVNQSKSGDLLYVGCFQAIIAKWNSRQSILIVRKFDGKFFCNMQVSILWCPKFHNILGVKKWIALHAFKVYITNHKTWQVIHNCWGDFFQIDALPHPTYLQYFHLRYC